MRLGIIGGLDRSRADYEQLAANYGLETEFHQGGMTGRAARGLEHMVDRCDLALEWVRRVSYMTDGRPVKRIRPP